MKPKTQRLSSGALAILMVILLLFSAIPSAHAVRYYDDQATLEITGDTPHGRYELTTDDLYFFRLTSFSPGDTWSGSIQVKNKTRGSIEVAVYDIVNNLKKDPALFEALDLEICVHDEVDYDGSYDVRYSRPVTDYYFIKPGRSLFFDVTVSMPGNAGNELQGKEMDSTWIIDSRYYEPPSDSDDTGPSALKYYVHYLDLDGNELLDTKVGFAYPGTKVTERAPTIPGYSPDAHEKSLIIKANDRDIYFIYTENTQPTPPPSDPVEPPQPDTPPTPDTPIIEPTPTTEPDIPTQPVDPGTEIQTGADLMQSNPQIGMVAFILALSIFAVVISYARIKQIRRYTVSNRTETKEDLTHEKNDQ